MSHVIRLVYLAFICIAQPAFANSQDVLEIAQVVQKYFDGTALGKPDLIREAFLPSLNLQTIRDGKLHSRTAEQYIEVFKPGQPHDRKATLLSVDVTGIAATAKAEITMGPRVYVDYFLLLKTPEGWKISNKIYALSPSVSQEVAR